MNIPDNMQGTLTAFQLSAEMVGVLENALGPGKAVEALGWSYGIDPRSHESTYRNQLYSVLNSHLNDTSSKAKSFSLDAQQNALDFLVRYRTLLLKEARDSFRLAALLMVAGILVVFAGVCLLWAGRIKTGSLTTGAGLVSNILGGLAFRLNWETHVRLDKAAKAATKLESIGTRLKALP